MTTEEKKIPNIEGSFVYGDRGSATVAQKGRLATIKLHWSPKRDNYVVDVDLLKEDGKWLMIGTWSTSGAIQGRIWGEIDTPPLDKPKIIRFVDATNVGKTNLAPLTLNRS